ncbi:MAG: hypothetical protein AAF515_14940 [Pseudomonadota bacterium]
MRAATLITVLCIVPTSIDATASADRGVAAERFVPVREVVVNPFERPATALQAGAASGTSDAQNQWRLKGVIEAGEQSIANVDGNIVVIGERIDGHQLIAVDAGSATFEGPQGRFQLTLDGETLE